MSAGLLERIKPGFGESPARFQTNQGSPKISAALMELIQPYLEGDISVDEYREILALGALAWNLSLFERDKRQEELSQALQDEKFAELADSQVFKSTLESMVARKTRLFPEDRRFIVAFDVVEAHGRYHVSAAAREIE